MEKSKFVYVTYIRTTPEKLWEALKDPKFTRQYWYESWQECDWKVGSTWKLKVPGDVVVDAGEVLEVEPMRKLVLSWRHEREPMRAEGFSRLTYLIEEHEESVKLTVLHEMDKADSKLIGSVSGGWPSVLASLKSLLETGESLEHTRKWPEGGCQK